MSRSEFSGRRIAVVGMARTGLAAAPVLRELGAEVILSDSAPPDRLGERLSEAYALGLEVRPGASPAAALEGADLVVPSPGVPAGAAVLRLAQERGLPILSEIDVAYRICRAPILAVTGTNGKTTTTVWLGEMLRASGTRTWVAGNVSADELKMPLITAAAEAGPDDAIVAEVSSFQLEWVEQFRPRVGILTNVTPDHMNRHASFGEYASCKARLFAAQRDDDVAVVNALNAPARAIGSRVRSRLLWFDRGHCFSRDSACVCGGDLIVRWNAQEHRLGRAADLQLPGQHNVENALAAAAGAIAFGVDPGCVSGALTSFEGVVHRMERVATSAGVLYINNSMCTNVDAAVRSIEAIGGPSVLICGGADKGSDFAALGAVIARCARHLIVMGSAAGLIEQAARDAGFESIARAASMEEAVELANGRALPGDVVMLAPACASFDMYANFESRGEAFRQAVRRLLAQG